MMTNLLEAFLIMLCRNKNTLTKSGRKIHQIDGVLLPNEVKQILDFMDKRLYSSIKFEEISRQLNRSQSWLTADKEKMVLKGKISVPFCLKTKYPVPNTAVYQRFFGFKDKKFCFIQNCFAPEKEKNSRIFRCEGRRKAGALQGQQAAKRPNLAFYQEFCPYRQ